MSAFYAIFCFAYIEHRCLSPALLRLGIPGGIKRYLDDILAILGVTGQLMVLQLHEFVEFMASEAVYPLPLKLNVEPEGDQEFLEAEVLKSDGTVKLKLMNKVVQDIVAGREGYRQRLASPPFMSQKQSSDLVRGIATRAVQACSDSSLLRSCLDELHYECVKHIGTSRGFWKAVTHIRTKYATNEMVMKAIRKY